MKFLFVFAALLIVVNGHQSTRFLPNSADPDKPGYCLHKELKLSFKEGDQVKPSNIGECVAFTCNKDGVIQINDCPAYPTFSHCTIKPVDLSKIFPECCATAKCTMN